MIDNSKMWGVFKSRPPPGLLAVLGLLERYMTPTLDSALLCSSRVGANLGRMWDRFEELCQLVVDSVHRASPLFL